MESSRSKIYSAWGTIFAGVLVLTSQFIILFGAGGSWVNVLLAVLAFLLVIVGVVRVRKLGRAN